MNKVPPILVMDFETGGLESQINPVTEFAGIFLYGDTLEEICRYEAILQPYNPELIYDPGALKATNITMEMLQAGVDFKTFAKDFWNFLRKGNIHSHVKFRPILAGHNIDFDIPFLQQLLHQMGKKMADVLGGKEDFWGHFQPKKFDTLPLSMIAWANEIMIDHKLGTCVQKAGFELVNAHRAMADVKANADLLKFFINNLRGKNNSAGLEEVIQTTAFRETFKF